MSETDGINKQQPSFSLQLFEPQEVFDERVAGRRIIYLDNNFWIELRDAAAAEARTCRDACLRAVNAGSAIFPLSYAAVSEVLENPSADARSRQADLMDALSAGVTLRLPNLIYAIEGAGVYRHLFHDDTATVPRREAFTALPDYGGTSTLHFPAGWRKADFDHFIDEFKRTTGSLRWLVDHLDLAQLQQNHKSIAGCYVKQMDKRREAQWGQFAHGRRIDRERLLREERTFLFKQYILPAVRRELLAEFGPEEGLRAIGRFAKERGESGPRRLAKLFRTAAPSLEVAAQVFAAGTLDRRRKTRRQDFWDIEHASVAPVYADVFVTADGWLRSLLRLKNRLPPVATATMLASLAELEDWLDNVVLRGDHSGSIPAHPAIRRTSGISVCF